MSFFDFAAAREMLPELLAGLKVTVEVTIIGFVISLVLGLVIAIARYMKIPVVSRLLTFFVLFIRGTPLLVQAYFAFNVLPGIGLTFSPFVTGFLVLGINYCAYTAEAYRGGIEAVPAGQWEAATALGLPVVDTWRRVILPDALRNITPVLGNYLIAMFKESAILTAITVAEMLTAAQNHLDKPMEAFTLVGLLFFIVSYPSSLLIGRLERRYAKH